MLVLERRSRYKVGMRFRAKLELNGKTATGFVVPPEVVEALGSSKKPAVKVTINGHTYRSSIAVMGGDFMLGVSADNRTAAKVSAGDMVDVDVELDTEPRVVTVPTDFSTALEANPKARQVFDKLAYSHKLRHVLVIEDAKTDET